MKLISKLKHSGFVVFFSLLLLSSCNNFDTNATYKVDFALNTPTGLVTTEHSAQYIKYNGLVEKPVVTVISDNTDNYRIEGWYTDSSYSSDSLWDFDIYTVKNILPCTLNGQRCIRLNSF